MIVTVIFNVRFQNSSTKKVRVDISFIEMPSIQNTKGILCGKTDGYSFGGTLPTITSYRIGKKHPAFINHPRSSISRSAAYRSPILLLLQKQGRPVLNNCAIGLI